MQTEVQALEGQEPANRLEVNWAEAEWFQVWLKLARRDYHGRPEIQKKIEVLPSSTPIAA